MKHIDQKTIFRTVNKSASEKETELVMSHISHCSECMEHYKAMESFNSLLSSSPKMPVPEDIYSRILDSIAEPSRELNRKLSYMLNGLFIFLVLAFGAASFFAGNSIGNGMLASKTSSINSMLADAAADEYPSGSVAEAIMTLNK